MGVTAPHSDSRAAANDAAPAPPAVADAQAAARPAGPGVRGLLPLFTILIAVTSVVLHLMGEELHCAYLQHWHLDVGLFPKSTDWLLINGFYGAMVVLAEGVLMVIEHAFWIPLVVIALGLYIGLLLTPLALPAAIVRWRTTWPRWIERTVALLVGAALLLTALLATLFLVFFLALIPSRLARHAGEKLAADHSQDFGRGCEASKIACVLVRKDGRELARGHVLESSTTTLRCSMPSTSGPSHCRGRAPRPCRCGRLGILELARAVIWASPRRGRGRAAPGSRIRAHPLRGRPAALRIPDAGPAALGLRPHPLSIRPAPGG